MAVAVVVLVLGMQQDLKSADEWHSLKDWGGGKCPNGYARPLRRCSVVLRRPLRVLMTCAARCFPPKVGCLCYALQRVPRDYGSHFERLSRLQ